MPPFRAQICLIASCVDADSVRDDEAFVRNVWARLRARFPGCVIVFIPEANLGKEASHLEMYVHDDPLTVTMAEVKAGWFGVHKSHLTTLEMHKKMAHVLSRRSLFIAHDLIGIPPAGAQRKQGMGEGTPTAGVYMAGQLRAQLRAYHWEATGTRSSLGEEVCRLTGKSGKLNDDLCIACLMAVYWPEVFWRSAAPNYTAAKRLMSARQA